jgi:hypothetical protein
MRNFQNVIILSAELSTNTFEGNRQRTLNLKGCLEDLNISHGIATGQYENFKSVSFVCLPQNLEEVQVLKDFAFKNFKQGSILEQDVNGLCHLVFEDTTSKMIGKLKPVKSTEGLTSYTKIGNVVYTTEAV